MKESVFSPLLPTRRVPEALAAAGGWLLPAGAQAMSAKASPIAVFISVSAKFRAISCPVAGRAAMDRSCGLRASRRGSPARGEAGEGQQYVAFWPLSPSLFSKPHIGFHTLANLVHTL